jgi:uncharacterized protein YabN with tetrapyrrole methylase and pyrophosphatase domain
MTEPLAEALGLQCAAAADGFDWSDPAALWAKLAEEIGELRAATTAAERRDELGDLLFMAVNLARHLGVDPVAALDGANRKFARRYAHVIAEPALLPPIGDPARIERMEARWQQAKRHERGLDD